MNFKYARNRGRLSRARTPSTPRLEEAHNSTKRQALSHGSILAGFHLPSPKSLTKTLRFTLHSHIDDTPGPHRSKVHPRPASAHQRIRGHRRFPLVRAPADRSSRVVAPEVPILVAARPTIASVIATIFMITFTVIMSMPIVVLMSMPNIILPTTVNVMMTGRTPRGTCSRAHPQPATQRRIPRGADRNSQACRRPKAVVVL